jgi:hypothetical protein
LFKIGFQSMLDKWIMSIINVKRFDQLIISALGLLAARCNGAIIADLSTPLGQLNLYVQL